MNVRLYNRYHSILQRCYNENRKDYKHYGGRGITVCDLWKNSYYEFEKWFLSKSGFGTNLSVDRINVDGNYAPDNCRLVDAGIQARNKRCTGKINFKGVSFWKNSNYYVASITRQGVKYFLGQFDSADNAAKARDFFIIQNGWSAEYSLNFDSFNYCNYTPVLHQHKQKNVFKKTAGIEYNNKTNRFYPRVYFNGKTVRLGGFKSKELAIEVRINWIKSNIKNAEIL